MNIDDIVDYYDKIRNVDGCKNLHRPNFVYQYPYASSSYYASTCDVGALSILEKEQLNSLRGSNDKGTKRFAIARPFCEFDAETIPMTFMAWNEYLPCDVLSVSQEGSVPVDLFLVYSQSYSENDVAIKPMDEMIRTFYDDTTSWSRCFSNIYAIETNIPQELDLYIPSAREELSCWINGPNRQFEGMYRIIQSGQWGDYESFYLMEGDSIPIKPFWLDTLLLEVEKKHPFAVLGA